MSADRVTRIICDGPHCSYLVLGDIGESVAELRDRADHRHHWVRVHPGRGRVRDYCPMHAGAAR